MRDAECLVEVEMADVGTESTRVGQTHQRVEVGTVDVDLPAVVMDDLADVGNALLEDAVGGGIGDHSAQAGRGTRRPWPRRSARSTLPLSSSQATTTRHAGHHRRRRVGAVRRSRDQADVAIASSPAAVIRPDRQQPGELTLRTGIGLDRHCVVAGYLGQITSRARRSVARYPCAWSGGAKGWIVGEIRPGDRDHLRRGVEFHRATPSGIIDRSRARSRSARRRR